MLTTWHVAPGYSCAAAVTASAAGHDHQASSRPWPVGSRDTVRRSRWRPAGVAPMGQEHRSRATTQGPAAHHDPEGRRPERSGRLRVDTSGLLHDQRDRRPVLHGHARPLHRYPGRIALSGYADQGDEVGSRRRPFPHVGRRSRARHTTNANHSPAPDRSLVRQTLVALDPVWGQNVLVICFRPSPTRTTSTATVRRLHKELLAPACATAQTARSQHALSTSSWPAGRL